MQLAGIELKYLVDDIGKKIEDYYVSNIYGITKNSLLFKLHHPETVSYTHLRAHETEAALVCRLRR